MSRFIVDTNVVSEICKDEPDAKVLEWMNRNVVYVPAPVVAELYDGMERESKPALKLRLRAQLDAFMDCTLPLDWDTETAITWAALWNSDANKLKPAPFYDSLIDAMAVRHNAVIVSRNVSDFRHSTVFDPWTGSEHTPGKASV